MTRDRDFKQVVRARMAETGESYTAARAAVEQRPAPAPTGGGTAEQAVVDQAAYDAARIEQERLVARLFTDGRLERVPGRRTTRAGALGGASSGRVRSACGETVESVNQVHRRSPS